MSDARDDELVARCREGDEAAFRGLVERYQRLVYGLVARLSADPSRVEDLAQEVFLRVYRGLPYFRGEARVSTWIYRIVTNLCLQMRARPAVEISLDAPDPDGRPLVQVGMADRAFDDLELRDRLEKALGRLPDRYRVLVAAHYLQGVEYEALAEALDLPLGTVKTHLHRAKRMLRELLTRGEV